MVFSTKKGLLECKPEWNREAITVFSRLPSLRRLQATPPLQTSLLASQIQTLKYFVTKLKLNDLYFGHSKFPSFSMSVFVICFGATGGDSSEETTIDGVILDFLFISGAIFNFSCVTGYLYFFRPSYSFIN